MTTRKQRLWQLGAAAVTAAAIVVIAVLVTNAHEKKVTGPALFNAIPQQGVVLGTPRATAHARGVKITPTFFLQRGNGPQRQLKFGDYTPGAFTPAIDSALRG